MLVDPVFGISIEGQGRAEGIGNVEPPALDFILAIEERVQLGIFVFAVVDDAAAELEPLIVVAWVKR